MTTTDPALRALGEAAHAFMDKHPCSKAGGECSYRFTLENALRAALAAETPETGLDVERLRTAMEAFWPRQGHKAEALAAEYAALRSPDTEGER